MDEDEKHLLLQFLNFLEEEGVYEPLSLTGKEVTKEKLTIIENFENYQNS